MPPCPSSARSTLLRRATTFAAVSRVRAPAMQAAAISPCEWPTTAAGSTPWACHSRASDTITANSNGWTTSGRSYASSGPAPRSVASRSQSVYGASAVAHCSIDAAKTSERSSRSRAMPSHCEPWPGKTSTALRSAAVRGGTTSAAASPAASASRAAHSAARSSPTTPALTSNRARPAASVRAVSASGIRGAVRRSWASSLAWAASAAGVLAASGSATASAASPWPAGSRSGPAASGAGASGASSTRTWALVPLTPNEETPARRTRGPAASPRSPAGPRRPPPTSRSRGRVPRRAGCAGARRAAGRGPS